MSLFFESIKIENGQPANIFFHNERLNKTRRDVLGIDEKLYLEKIIKVPDHLKNKVYKCRLFYDYDIHKVEFLEYKKREIIKIRLVKIDSIEYSYKYSDREEIDKLKKEYSPSGEEDIIIVKNGLLTDSSFSNVLLYDGNKWVTPAKPLLCGTQRAKLLTENRIFERDILVTEISSYHKIKLINAMVGFEDAVSLPINCIKL